MIEFKYYRLSLVKLILFLMVLIPAISFGAVRTWSGGTTGTVAWTGNWTGQADPTSADDVTITTGGTLIITGVPTVTLNSLTIAGGSGYTVELQGATTTLTIGGNAGVDLTVNSSTTLILSGTGQILNLTMAASATATVTGTLQVNAGATFNTDAASVVSTIDGTLTNSGTVTCATASKLVFSQTGVYTHSQDGGTLPKATWNSGTPGATCNITGYVSTRITGLITTYNTFHHLTWNCTGQTDNGTDSKDWTNTGETVTCNGNLTITSTNSNKVEFNANNSDATVTLNVGGNLVVSGGQFVINDFNTLAVVNVTGDINVSSGVLYMQRYSGNATSVTTLNLTGNLNISSTGTFYAKEWGEGTDPIVGPTLEITGNVALTGTSTFTGTTDVGDPTINITGTLTTAAGTTFYGTTHTSGKPTFTIQGSVDLSAGTTGASSVSSTTANLVTINLTGTGSNNLTLPTALTYDKLANWTWTIGASRTVTLLSNVEIGGNNTCGMTVNGTLITGTYIIKNSTGTGTAVTPFFTTASGSILKIGNATGSTTAGITSSGATGSIQVTGTRTFHAGTNYHYVGTTAQNTGNGLPASINSTGGLTINNSAGVTQSQATTLSGALTMTSGDFDLNSFNLTLGTTGSISGETSSNRVKGTGEISVTSNMSANNTAYTCGGTGLTITTQVAGNVPGSTTVVRGHSQQTGGFNNRTSITRYYTITPTTNTTLGATLKMEFFAAELNGQTANSNMKLWRAESPYGQYDWDEVASTWTDAAIDFVTATGVAAFSRWTVSNNASNALPVTLLDFKATPNDNNNVDITWSTYSETNNDYFTIDKTQDGETFDFVATIKGAGNSNSILNYTTVDENPYLGRSFYRLKQTDYDGKYEYFPLADVSIFNAGQGFNVTLYPNPLAASDILNVKLNGLKNDEVLISVQDLLGKIHYSKTKVLNKNSEALTIDFEESLAPGMYLVTGMNNGVLFSKKILIK